MTATETPHTHVKHRFLVHCGCIVEYDRIGGQPEIVCVAYCPPHNYAEDMLEACQAAHTWIHKGKPIELDGVIHQLATSIQKATGG